MSTGDAPAPHAATRPVVFRGRDGLRLAGDAVGDPSAPPVVLLHGGGQTRHAWGGTAAALARAGWHALSLDLRGHGDSEWAPDGDYTLDALVADLRMVLPALERPPALVGASLGGMTALAVEGEAAISVCRALVLVDVAPRVEPLGVQRIMAFMRAHQQGFATLEEAADAIAAYNRHRPRPRDPSGLQKNLRVGADGRHYWHWDPALVFGDRPPGAVNRPDRLENAARRLRVPTLLVRGLSSDVVSEAGVRSFLALAPGARAVDVSGAGHMVAGDRNDAFTAAVVTFLTTVL